MSNMKPNLIPWYAIYSQKFMFRQKLLEMFKYKVKCGEYIAFDGYPSLIYQEIRDDAEFYKSYYKNYSEYFEHYGKAAHQAIECDCLIAVKVIVEEQLFTPTLNTLIRAISRNRLEIIKYLLEPQFNLKQHLNEDIICDVIFQTKDVNTFKVINYLIEDIKINGSGKIKEVVQNAYKDYFLSLIPTLSSIQTKLSVVLNICKFIYIFNIPIISTSTTSTTSTNQLISYDEILKLKFTNEQLESGLNNSVNYYNQESRESIIRLVNLLHQVQDFESLFGKKYKCLYLYKADMDLLISSSPSTLNQLIKHERLLKKSFQYGSFQLFKVGCEFYRNSFCYNTFELFEYCPNKDIQIQFFSSLINSFKQDQFYKSIVSPSRLVHPLLEYGCLELVKLFFQDLVELIKEEGCEFDIGKISFIKSTEILEYLFLNHTHYFINKTTSKSVKLDLFGYKMINYYNSLVKSYSNNNNNNQIIFFDAANNLDHELDNYGLNNSFYFTYDQITKEIIDQEHLVSEIIDQSLLRGNNKTIIRIIELILINKSYNYKEQLEKIILKVIKKQSLSTLNEILASYPNIFNSSYSIDGDMDEDDRSSIDSNSLDGSSIFTRYQLFNFFVNSIKLNFLKGSEILFENIQITKRQFLDLDKIFSNINPTFNYLNLKYLKY